LNREKTLKLILIATILLSSPFIVLLLAKAIISFADTLALQVTQGEAYNFALTVWGLTLFATGIYLIDTSEEE